MASNTTYQRQSVNSSAAIKVPVKAATTANVTLSGEQTIDGVALVADDRVLVKNQTDASENGVYDVDTSSWTRSPDWDGKFDIVQGTVVHVNDGTTNIGYWKITTANPITVGTSNITFAVDGPVTYTPAGTGAVERSVKSKLDETVSVTDFGAVGNGSTDDTTQGQLLIDGGNGKYIFPAGTFIIDTLAFPASANIVLRGQGKGITTLKHKAGSTSSMLTSASRVSRIEIKDMTIDGNRGNVTDRSVYPVEFTVDNIHIHDVEFTGSVKGALRITDLTGWGIVTGCDFEDGANHSGVLNEDTLYVHVTQSAANESLFIAYNNRLIGQTPTSAAEAPAGIVINADDTTISTVNQKAIIYKNYLRYLGCDIAGNISSPIHCYRNSDNSIIEGNIIEDSCNTPIRWQKSNNFKIHHNIVDGETQYSASNGGAIKCSGRSTVTQDNTAEISFNVVKGMASAAYGIEMEYSSSGEFSDLRVFGNDIETCLGGIRTSRVNGSIDISKNKLRDITSAKCILVEALGGTSFNNSININDNKFFDCDERPIFLNDGVTTDAYVTCKDNYMFQVGTTSGGSAISIKNITHLNKSGNTLIAGTGGITAMYSIDTSQTIATGAITVYGSGVYTVDTESAAASDDLDTISGGQFDDEIVLQAASSSRDVVAKDGTGNLVLAGDFTMDNVQDKLLLRYDGTNWNEISRSNNGA